MEKKEPIKVSLPVFLAIVVLFVALVFGAYMYMQNQKLEKEIAKLQERVNQSQTTKDELEEKLNNISNIASTNNKTDNKDVLFSEAEVKVALSDYFELKCSIGTGPLIILTEKGVLNYNEADNTEVNYETHTKVKFSDYKEAMLNFVTEEEFKRNFDKDGWLLIDDNGYYTVGEGIGGPGIHYTVLSITKKNDTSYTAKTSYIEDGRVVPEDVVNENYSFTIKSYNGHCVIDSISKI